MALATDRQSTHSTGPHSHALTETKSYDSLISSKSSTQAAKELYSKGTKPTNNNNNHNNNNNNNNNQNNNNNNNCNKNNERAFGKFVPSTNEVRKRVLSARILRKKTFNNQLVEAEQTIANLKQENRMLLTIHQRQDAALAKYESTNAVLPNLLNVHVEELNVWEQKYRKLQVKGKEVEEKLKQKESIIMHLHEQIRMFAQLNKNKNLGTKEQLLEKIDTIKTELALKESEQNHAVEILQSEINRVRRKLRNEEIKVRDFNDKLQKSQSELSCVKKVKPFIRPKLNLTKKPKANSEAESEQYCNDDTDSSFRKERTPGKKPLGIVNSRLYIKPIKRTSKSQEYLDRGAGDGDKKIKCKPNRKNDSSELEKANRNNVKRVIFKDNENQFNNNIDLNTETPTVDIMNLISERTQSTVDNNPCTDIVHSTSETDTGIECMDNMMSNYCNEIMSDEEKDNYLDNSSPL